MAYALKFWTFTETAGWQSQYDPLPRTREDALNLANWWAAHWPEDVKELEIQILRGGEIVERFVIKEGRLNA